MLTFSDNLFGLLILHFSAVLWQAASLSLPHSQFSKHPYLHTDVYYIP